MTHRVKCLECDNLILPQTAADNGGLCGQCAKVSPDLRAEKRDFERRLSAGLLFVPSDHERSTSAIPEVLTAGQWQLQPEYYAGSTMDSPLTAITAARSQLSGNIFLVSANGGELNLGFTARYGVCEFQNLDTGEFRYAYSELNLREQVPADLHVVQACPCCGVGMLWYPSRFHMPRDQAFTILECAVGNRRMPGVEWLDTDDFSYTGRGRG